MHNNIMRAGVAVAATAALAALGVAGGSASAAATRAPRAATAASAAVSHAPGIPGAQLWVERYSGPAHKGAAARSVTASPSGSTVFVTGYSRGATSQLDYSTVAYDAATGAQLWVEDYNGPGNRNDIANSVAVSPTGSTVFVTGYSTGAASGPYDYATVAYDAATGTQLWVKRYNGPGNGADYANTVAVSPTGNMVFVTGQSTATVSNFATIAYSS